MEQQKDNPIKRTARGFKILLGKLKEGYLKLVNSSVVQNIKDNNEKSDPNEFMPNYTEQFSSDDNYQWSMFDEKDKKKSNVI
jgi:hypothetical protein